jgi:hypothetical protein
MSSAKYGNEESEMTAEACACHVASKDRDRYDAVCENHNVKPAEGCSRCKCVNRQQWCSGGSEGSRCRSTAAEEKQRRCLEEIRREGSWQAGVRRRREVVYVPKMPKPNRHRVTS